VDAARRTSSCVGSRLVRRRSWRRRSSLAWSFDLRDLWL
jgi:hypothetical protein